MLFTKREDRQERGEDRKNVTSEVLKIVRNLALPRKGLQYNCDKNNNNIKKLFLRHCLKEKIIIISIRCVQKQPSERM